jgi:hypothetical protein
MFSRTPRWNWLAFFAICNLVFWIAVAIGVGVLATDTLDLGVESFIRTQQATAVAVWNRVASVQLLAPARAPDTAVAAPAAKLATAMPTTAVSVARPIRTPTLAMRPTATPVAWPQSTQVPTPSLQFIGEASTDPAAAPLTPTSQPAEAALSGPLLISDPDVAGMARIDAEMARSAAGRPVQIRYSEASLNRQVAALLASYPDLPYQNLQVDLRRDQVILKGNVTVMGFQVTAEVQGILTARDCLPQAEITRISIAGVLTPGFVRDSIEAMVIDSLSSYPSDYPLCLEQIVLEEDRVTIYGSRR